MEDHTTNVIYYGLCMWCFFLFPVLLVFKLSLFLTWWRIYVSINFTSVFYRIIAILKSSVDQRISKLLGVRYDITINSSSIQHTSPMTSAGRQMSRLDIVCVRLRHRLWLCAVRGCRRAATELSRLPPRESGTVCHITSRLHSHCLFSAVV